MLQEIFSPDPALAGILRKQTGREEKALRWSVFLFPFEHRGERYLYHSLTKQCYRTDASLFAVACAGAVPSCAGERQELSERWFLVPKDMDETALFEGLQRLLYLYSSRSKLYFCTIFTTTACNARCFYCFEQGFQTVTMSPETVKDTLAFLLRNRDPNRRLHLRWFGGEPLAAPQVIDQISAGLTEAGVDFEAAMITNGLLIDEKTLAKMTGPWRIRRLQITLDGNEAEYNRRKNYLRPYPSAFRELLGVLRRLMDSPVAVVLRCNVDRNNVYSLQEMLEVLARALPQKGNFFPYFTLLNSERTGERDAELFRSCLEAKLYARDLGFPYVPQAPLHKTRTHICAAENPYGTAVVAADGVLYNCDRLTPDRITGNVREGFTRHELLKTFAMPDPVSEKCRDCCFLTSCTSFSRCPDLHSQCREVRETELLCDLRCELDRQGAPAGTEFGSGEEPEPLC